jgi:hypothetical protein
VRLPFTNEAFLDVPTDLPGAGLPLTVLAIRPRRPAVPGIGSH